MGSEKVRAMVRVRRKNDEGEKNKKKETIESEARVAAMWRFDLCANFVPVFAGDPWLPFSCRSL